MAVCRLKHFLFLCRQRKVLQLSCCFYTLNPESGTTTSSVPLAKLPLMLLTVLLKIQPTSANDTVSRKLSPVRLSRCVLRRSHAAR